MPEQNGAEADINFGVDSTSEGGAAPESTTPLESKAVPEAVAAKSSGSIAPEETLTVVAPEEAKKSQPEPGPDGFRVKGLPAGQSGATGKLNLDLGCLSCCVACANDDSILCLPNSMSVTKL